MSRFSFSNQQEFGNLWRIMDSTHPIQRWNAHKPVSERGDRVTHYDDLAAAAKRGDAQFVLEHADGLLLDGGCPQAKVGWVFYYKCDAALEMNKPVLAIAAGEQALTWAQGHREAELEARVRICLACAMLRLGRVAEVAALLEGYLSGMKRRPQWRKYEDLARYHLATAYRHSGRLPEAAAQYRKALEVPGTNPEAAVQIRQNLAWALLLLGDTGGAREQLDLVAENVRQTLSLGRLTSLWVDRAALHLLEGDTAGAKAACRQVLAALDEKVRAIHLATTYITLGRIALVEGDTAEAQRCSMLARSHAEKAERWDLHNEATHLWVTATQKGGTNREEETLAAAVRLLVAGHGDP
jgi:tetratricopeptide (TPR) repeat protein